MKKVPGLMLSPSATVLLATGLDLSLFKRGTKSYETEIDHQMAEKL